mgnify:CR=1 FL=1
MLETLKKQERIRGYLDRLAGEPPQVVLLEGGDAGQRFDLGLYLAAALNCGKAEGACLECPDCVRMLDRADRDLFVFDNAAEPVAIKELRAVVPEFSQPPRGTGKRSVIFNEAQYLNLNCANLLLKSLEEPRPHTVFMLLVPQRERLLPTLVSRSWVMTLSWPGKVETDEIIGEWLKAIADFLMTGKGLFARTSQKGAVDRDLALAIVGGCQRELADHMSGRGGAFLSSVLSRYDQAGLRRFDIALAKAVESLSTPTPVHPAMVIDWLATRMAPRA